MSIELGVLGMGQIGGSLAAAVSRSDRSWTVRAYDPVSRLTAQALTDTIIAVACDSETALIEQSDVVVIATHLDVAEQILTDCREALATKQLVVDTASVKAEICDHARSLGLSNFVGGHPMAGTEKSAPDAWDPALFRATSFMYAASNETPQTTTNVLKKLIDTIGANPVPVDPRHHDRGVGLTIAMPHLLAFALRRILEQVSSETGFTDAVVGPSFRSATRVADSERAMVAQLIRPNSDALICHLATLEALLRDLKDDLKQGGTGHLHRLLGIEEGD